MDLKKLTTLQKALLGLAGAGLLVLLYDQFGGPAHADAASAGDASPASSAAPTAPSPAAGPAAPSLGARLRAVPNDSAGTINDPFVKSLPRSSPSRVSEVPADSSFASKYRMTGTMTSGNSRAAMINGVLIRRGQSIDGYRLVEVTATGATFESRSGERITLRMGADTPDSSSGLRRRGSNSM